MAKTKRNTLETGTKSPAQNNKPPVSAGSTLSNSSTGTVISGVGNPLKSTEKSTQKSFFKKNVDKNSKPVEFVFTRENYKWMFIGIGFLILGYILMSGTTDIMSNTKIVIAPLFVLIGFGIEFYAILLNPIKKA